VVVYFFEVKCMIYLLSCIVFFFSLSFPVTTVEAGTKKIAVFDFENAAHDSLNYSGKENGKGPVSEKGKGNIGRTIADLIITELVRDGAFKVIERSQIEKVLAEQKLSASGLVDTAAAANIGKILGVSAVVVGSVTQYGLGSSSVGVLGIGSKKIIANVAAAARIIDTTTAEIISAVEGKGMETASGFKMGDYADVDDTGLSDTIMGNATSKAVGNIVQQLKEQATKLQDAVITGAVAFVDQNKKSCIIDLGQNDGIQKDMSLYVMRVTREIKSPTTGQIIRKITEPVAELKITDCDKVSSDAVCLSGICDNIKEGDQVSSAK
jgi:curli biogenesis system outer membrane secretion channel CsgG